LHKPDGGQRGLVVTPAAEGAANHCIMENRSLMSQEVFDWLDDRFGDAKQIGH
jgi:hypothetical protein